MLEDDRGRYTETRNIRYSNGRYIRPFATLAAVGSGYLVTLECTWLDLTKVPK